MNYSCYQIILWVKHTCIYTNHDQCTPFTECLSLRCWPGNDWENTWHWTKSFTLPTINCCHSLLTTAVVGGFLNDKGIGYHPVCCFVGKELIPSENFSRNTHQWRGFNNIQSCAFCVLNCWMCFEELTVKLGYMTMVYPGIFFKGGVGVYTRNFFWGGGGVQHI
jgi:hypothetical protein